jgi:hypothetical protein
MKAKIIFVLTLILILIMYSSEIVFMPNYQERSDMWHLFTWIMIFCTTLIFVAILNLIFMLKSRKTNLEVLLILFLTFLFFTFLNNPKSNLQEVGFIGMILIVIYCSFFSSRIKLKSDGSHL